MLTDGIRGIQVEFVSQVAYAFAVGLIVSWITQSLILVLTFMIVYESFLFFAFYKYGMWNAKLRITVMIVYLFSWFIGRTLHGLKVTCINRDFDVQHLKR